MRRSMLFVPGNTPKMMTSCGFFGADAVIFDLEDAVSPTEKDAARDLVRYAIGNLHLCGSEVIVRVNSIETPMFLADLAAVVPQKPDLIMLPKTCTAEDIQMLAQTLDRLEAENGLPAGAVGILALIETALGVENAFSIASASPRVQALFLGAEDLSADLHCKRTKEGTEIQYARTRLGGQQGSMSTTRLLRMLTMMKDSARTLRSQRASALPARRPSRRAISAISTAASAPRRQRSTMRTRCLQRWRKESGRAAERSRCMAK